MYRAKLNGKLRVCVYPKGLNKVISREHHVIPTLEEILPKPGRAKCFSNVDAKCFYWNVELDQDNHKLSDNLQFAIWPLQISAHAVWRSIASVKVALFYGTIFNTYI